MVFSLQGQTSICLKGYRVIGRTIDGFYKDWGFDAGNL